ncbi:MAG TPA: LPS export ABC transporter periplasmic protein LptC, partial [Sedimentisphaerales bacterium]|nr:LPS export ABC transporter periplasmic protein LptC [Sedimentisphaerales bacterium]
MRKILVGLVALAFIVGAYVMYSRSSKTPTIKIGGGADVNDINVPTFDGQGGRIGPATVDVLRGTTYIHRDAKTKRIDREFGFAELVRTIGETWEVDKPWMKVYQQDFQLDITADRGITEIQTVVGSSTPKDAIFQGNVTIRILPLEQKKYRETTIHLDNLIFLSDKSQFSTAGPVKLVSEDMNMDGKGLEFVYNDQTEQLDYLRLQRLDSMRIRSSAAAAVSRLDSKPSEQSPQKAPQADS